MKNLVFALCSSVCMAQTNQYKKILLSKKTGKEVNSYSGGYGTVYDAKTKTRSIVDSLGNITFESPYSISHIFKNRFILTEEANYKTKSAVIDEKGNQLLPLDNQSFNTPWLSDKRIISSKEGKDAVYDYNGKQIIPYSDRIQFAGEDRFFIMKDKKWFLYDLDGKQISDRTFKEDYHFENGKALIINEDNQSEIIGKDGQTLHQFSTQIYSIASYPYLITRNRTTGKYGLVDAEDHILAEEIFDDAAPEYFGTKQYVYLRKKGKASVFNKKDRKLYPNNFKYLTPLFNDLFTVYSDKLKKTGVVNLHGDIIVPQEYDFIQNFNISGKDFIYLKKGKEEQFLNQDLKNILDENTQVIAFYPDHLIIKKQDSYYQFSVLNQSASILKDIVSIKEQEPDFFNIFNLYSKPVVCRNTSNLYGIMDEKGKEIVPFIYDDIIAFENSENEIVVKKQDKYGVVNFQNEPLKDIIYDKYYWQKEVLKLDKDKKTDILYFTRFKNSGSRL
ncbi:WG repeat-containing protein [Chryseobacterium sp. RP-3-3]|uniref:WG repeat-containing protein n=1 Tax=Chryseobacterium antibioticum TaxID=2728847 RepID=A0A7Y0FQP7_9FLAO|nr:WG repeat-containing protein [Chryseobacterium antibioticum]NML68895.1 WG repeat-containing protein [Chryseobacterium antibioticum]